MVGVSFVGLFAMDVAVAGVENARTDAEDCCRLYVLGKSSLLWTVLESGQYPGLSRARCVLCNVFLMRVVATGFIRR